MRWLGGLLPAAAAEIIIILWVATGRDANSATLYKTFISISFHYVEINQVIQSPSQTDRLPEKRPGRTEGQTLSDEESVWAPVGISVVLACCSSL